MDIYVRLHRTFACARRELAGANTLIPAGWLHVLLVSRRSKMHHDSWCVPGVVGQHSTPTYLHLQIYRV
jgi:hypothetical protein